MRVVLPRASRNRRQLAKRKNEFNSRRIHWSNDGQWLTIKWPLCPILSDRKIRRALGSRLLLIYQEHSDFLGGWREWRIACQNDMIAARQKWPWNINNHTQNDLNISQTIIHLNNQKGHRPNNNLLRVQRRDVEITSELPATLKTHDKRGSHELRADLE